MDGGIGGVVGINIPFILTGLVGNPFLPKLAKASCLRVFALATDDSVP